MVDEKSSKLDTIVEHKSSKKVSVLLIDTKKQDLAPKTIIEEAESLEESMTPSHTSSTRTFFGMDQVRKEFKEKFEPVSARLHLNKNDSPGHKIKRRQ